MHRTSLGIAMLALLAGAGCQAASPADTTVVDTPHASATANPNALVWALPSAPTTLDPSRMLVDPAATQVSAQIYDRLVRFRPGTPELAPGIAADWDADASGKTYTFSLREGLRFHDGTPLDATAVTWNFRRWLDPDHPQHNGEFRAYVSLFGGYEGQVDSTGRPVNMIENVEALDPLTVRFTLREGFAPFLYHLALTPLSLASPAAVRAQGEKYGSDGSHLPVGSGPFRIAEWSPDGNVVLVANEDYWAGAPRVPALRFVVIPDAARRIAAVVGGSVHGVPLDATTPVSGVLATEAVRVLPRPSRSTAWLMLNFGRAPLDDVRVRRAIDMAVDRPRLVRERFGGESLPAAQLLPPGFVGYDTSLLPTAYAPDTARALLAEAGHADGFELNVWVPNTARGYLPDPIGTADTLAGMLRDIGIRASVRSEGLRQFLADREHGRFTAWIVGWEASSADPDNFWYFHFGAGRAPAEGQYINADLASSLLLAQRTVGGEARAEIYRAAAQTVAHDVARVFLAHARALVAVSPRVTGFVPGSMDFDDFAAVELAAAPRGATAAPARAAAPLAATPGTVTASAVLTPTTAFGTVAPSVPTATAVVTAVTSTATP